MNDRKELSKYLNKLLKIKGEIAIVDGSQFRLMLKNVFICYYEDDGDTKTLLQLDHLWLNSSSNQYHPDKMDEMDNIFIDMDEYLKTYPTPNKNIVEAMKKHINEDLKKLIGKEYHTVGMVFQYRRNNGSSDYGIKQYILPTLHDVLEELKFTTVGDMLEKLKRIYQLAKRKQLSLRYNDSYKSLLETVVGYMNQYQKSFDHEQRAIKNQPRHPLTSDPIFNKSKKKKNNKKKLSKGFG